ncbi:MAG: UDP-N-acetylglucosamine 1-carboxyvinyltransferase, partial [Anaerovorax sp.]
TAMGATGETIIINAAREPEIVDLQNFLNSCGAKIIGGGTSQIRIKGNGFMKRNRLHDTEYSVMADRIECGTFLCAAAITGGSVLVNNIDAHSLTMTLSKLVEAGCEIGTGNGKIQLSAPEKLTAVDCIKTQPYPGFPTDMQSQFLSAMTVAKGTGIITETIFENRFKQVDQLRKMGAKISVEGRNAIVTGVPYLTGARVCAKDLRGGASLVLAALVAEGETKIEDIFHIDRGYENMEEKLLRMCADIVRI